MTSRLDRLSLRSRLMAVGIAGVAGALLVGGLLLYAAMSAALDRATVHEARASAVDVASLVDAGRLPDPVPASGALVVQVLDSQNRVTSGSATADRLTALVTPAEASRLAGGDTLVVPGNRAGVGGELRVVGVRAGPQNAQVLVVAGVPTADLEASRRVLLNLMLVFFPCFLLVVAAIAWWVVGRTLRPVEQLRRGAARIGESADPGERLPVLESGDEIAALAATLNAMLERLSSASAKQRAFVADAAHELRSPLATMRTQLEVAERVGEGGSLPAELQPEVARLSALVEDLLVLARGGPEAGPATRAPVDLVDVLRAAQTRHRAGRVPVRLVDPDRPGHVVVLASRPELVRAIGNLVDNAVRHATTEVVLACGPDHDGWRATVSDDGTGIPEEELERVFDRFARLDEARDRDSGGSGLGLAIARELLRRNGARVWLEDADPGVRAVVVFDAPPPPG